MVCGKRSATPYPPHMPACPDGYFSVCGTKIVRQPQMSKIVLLVFLFLTTTSGTSVVRAPGLRSKTVTHWP